MSLHATTFHYIKPNENQMLTMNKARMVSEQYALALEQLVPDGPDKTYLLRKVREVAMWVNVAITREANGAPRE